MAVTVQEAQVVFSAEGMGKVASEAAKAKGAMSKLAGAASQVGSSLRGAFSGIGAQLGALGAAAGAAKIFQLSANAEQTAISLEVLTGSAESAKQMLTEIRALDMKTVFGTKDLADNAKLMMQQGMGAEQAMKTLTGLTEIAAGDAEALSRLSLAMAQVNNAGRLTGQDLLQLINAGFNPLKIISDKTGESMGDLRKKMEQGAISADQVQWALTALTTGSGRLAGMNERISQTTAGMFAKMKSSLELVAIEFGTALLPTANKFLQVILESMPQITSFAKMLADGVLSAIDWFTYAQDQMAKFGVAIGVVAANFGSLWEAEFNDLTNLAGAAWRYLTENGMNALRFLRDAAAQMSPSNLIKIARGEAAFAFTGMNVEPFKFESQTLKAVGDIATQIAEAQADYAKQTAAASAQALMSEKERLAAAEAARQAARNAGQEAFPGGAATAAGAAMARAQIERGSAASIFTSIADKLANKAMEEIGKAQLKAQQEANKIATQTLQAISILPFGLQ
jgi:tape measure domain-containing protein